jgi:GTP:adenosylcobinamide-phosphate guanylyltransferase
MHTFDSLCVSSDLLCVNPATLNRMILYYRLMTKWSGLGDSTELSRMGLSQLASEHLYAPE